MFWLRNKENNFQSCSLICMRVFIEYNKCFLGNKYFLIRKVFSGAKKVNIPVSCGELNIPVSCGELNIPVSCGELCVKD